MDISSLEITPESIVLLTIASVTITYLEEKKFKSDDEESILTKDSKSMLEELRMQGIGDGIVKKVIKALNGIKNIFSVIGKHLGAAVGGIIDMFAYTAILIPVMNAILSVIGIHEMSVDDVISNFFSLSIGVATRIAKHGLVEILDKLRNFVSPSSKREILDDLETPVIQKFGDFINEKDSDWKNNILLESNSNKIDKEYLRDKYNSYIKKCKRSCKPKKVKSGTFGGKTGKQQTVKIRKSKTKNTRKSQK
jgi:hypothetical protein